MESIDRAFARAWRIFDEDLSDETDAELGDLLPVLVDAGYVAVDGESPTGEHWRFTAAGVEHAKALGLD